MATSKRAPTTTTTIASLRNKITALEKVVGKLSQAAKPDANAAAEVAALRKENAALLAQLEAKHPAVTSNDFASAIRNSLDDMQRTIAVMDNPVSDFAVKEFTLQANVVMQIDRLGHANYRFLRPGEQVDERALSRLNINLVPLPKQTLQGQILARGGGEIDIEAIDGIGDQYRKLLNKSGIYSVADLLKTGTRVRSRAELAGLLKVERDKLGAWLLQAELMTIKDVGEFGAKALRISGIHSLGDLARQEPAALLQLVQKHIDEHLRKKLGEINEMRVKAWIDAAKTYLGKVEPAPANAKNRPTT